MIELQILLITTINQTEKVLQEECYLAGYKATFDVIETEEELHKVFRTARPDHQVMSWDLIIAQYSSQNLNTHKALRLFHESTLNIPFIVYFEMIDEISLAGIIKAGADDYFSINNLSHIRTIIQQRIIKKESTSIYEPIVKITGIAPENISTILETADDAIIIINEDQSIRYFNQGASRIFGYAPNEVIGQPLDLLLPEALHEKHSKHILDFHSSPETARRMAERNEVCGLRKNGNEFPAEASISNIITPDGMLFTAIVRDISEKKRHHTEQRKSEEYFRLMTHHMSEVFWMATPDLNQILYVSPAYEQVWGQLCSALYEQPALFVQAIHPEDRKRIKKTIAEKLDFNQYNLEYRVIQPDKSIHWIRNHVSNVRNDNGEIVRIIGIAKDITEQKQNEEQLIHLATHDSLTKLPNRSLLQDRLEQAILIAKRHQKIIAILLVDLDHFKLINDNYGHSKGDYLLTVIGKRLREAIRESDTVSRTGGDEFVIILTDLTSKSDIKPIIYNIFKNVAAPIVDNEHELHVTCSMGISIYPEDGEDPETLFKHSDIAMYYGKSIGRNNHQFYNPTMSAGLSERMTLLGELRHALEKNELFLHYQPQIDLQSGTMYGAEVLLRWKHPELGLIPPNQFIPIAEETGLIGELFKWTLKTACKQNVAWQQQGLPPIMISVNISPIQFRQQYFVEDIESLLIECGLDAKYLELEVTENLTMESPEYAITIMKKIRDLGVSLAIDDFGTGYSSMGYLKRYPVNRLKIDISFIRDIVRDPNDAMISSTIIAIGHQMGYKVIAEGVETEGQLAYLTSKGCDEIQGYYCSRPVPSDEFIKLLDKVSWLDVEERHKNLSRRNLLIVDSHKKIFSSLKKLLLQDGYNIITTSKIDTAFEELAIHKIGVVIYNQQVTIINDSDFLSQVKIMHPSTIRIVLSGDTDIENSDDAINIRKNIEGAFKLHEKNVENTQLKEKIDGFSRIVI